MIVGLLVAVALAAEVPAEAEVPAGSEAPAGEGSPPGDAVDGPAVEVAVPAPAVPPDPFHDALAAMRALDEHGYAGIGASRVIEALARHPDHPTAPLIRLGLARFQRNVGMYEHEVRTLEVGVGAQASHAAWFRVAVLDAHLQQGAYGITANLFDTVDRWEPEVTDAAHLYGAWGRLGRGDDHGAQVLLAKVRGPLQPDARALQERLVATTPLPRRSPGLARGLAVVPGLGHAYSGAWGAAVGNVVVQGALAGTTWWLASRDEPVLAGVSGTLLGLAWLGSIGEAGRRAGKFNERVRQERFDALRGDYWPQADLTGELEAPLRVHVPDAP